MEYDLYLSYSGRKSYLTCPRQYHFRYVLKAPGRGDPRGSIFGSAIGRVFQWFYDRRLWAEKDPTAACLSVIDEAIESVFREAKFDPTSDHSFRSVVRQDMLKYVPAGVKTIQKLGLLTVNSRAEVDLSVLYGSEKYGMSVKMGGRADFVHSPDMRSVSIIDGKASKYREKYVDSEQLIWYAVQHYIKYHVAPVRLGFLFWAFPDDPIKWIAYDSQAMRASVDKTFEVAKKIQLKMFDATPSGVCHRCDYKGQCEDGRKYLAHRKRETGGGYIENSIFDLEMVSR